MQRRNLEFLAILAVLSGGIGVSPASAQGCACGPLYCQNDSGFPAALKGKKQALAKAGYPSQFISLLDKGGQCLVCVGTGSPDIFTILSVQPNGDNETIPWDKDNERISQTQLLSGKLDSYYVYNVRRACTCCGEPKAEQRSDYDASLSLNRNTAIKCVKGADNKVTCS